MDPLGPASGPGKDHTLTVDTHRLHALADSRRLMDNPHDVAAELCSRAEGAILAGWLINEPIQEWVLTLHRYEAFWQEHGNAPRENTRALHTLESDERRLGDWARYQRRFRDTRNSYQLARLDVSPAFEWDPWEARWQRNYEAVRLHVERTRDLPRLRQSDPVELALARWFNRQLEGLHDGVLPEERRRQIEQLLRWIGRR